MLDKSYKFSYNGGAEADTLMRGASFDARCLYPYTPQARLSAPLVSASAIDTSTTGGLFALVTAMSKGVNIPEQAIYDALDHLEIRYEKQKRFGKYRVDAYLPKYKIALEVDGEGHRGKQEQRYDYERSQDLLTLGIATLRVSNEDALADPIGTVQEIMFLARVFGVIP